MSTRSAELEAALRDLLKLHDVKYEYERRKQRRIHWLRRDPDEVAAVAALKAEYDRLRTAVWANARALLL